MVAGIGRREHVESRAFDAWTRRASLLTLGIAGLGTLGAPLADAKKRKKKKGDVNKFCKTQVEPCVTLLPESCGGNEECIEAMTACCAFLGTCDYLGLVDCIADIPDL
jgi:hypothetical protein